MRWESGYRRCDSDLIDMPIIKDERCVHSMMEQATCQACVQACPRQAIRLTDEALTLDGGRCDGCGLCVPACPEQAISVEGEPLLRQPFWGRAEALAACSRAVASGPGVLACLNAIGSSQILSYYRHGIAVWYIAHGDCAACFYGKARSFDQHIEDANKILQSHALPEIQVTRGEPGAWTARRSKVKVSEHPERRRTFLRAVARLAPPEEASHAARKTQECDVLMTNWLPSPAGLLPWSVSLDARRCVGCGSCAEMCRHGAIRLESDYGFRVDSLRCTGCGVCRDVCPADAIRLERLAPARQFQMPLTASRCKGCGNPFHQPVKDEPDEYCHVCRSKPHSRHLFQVLS
jgi:ferredoxin